MSLWWLLGTLVPLGLFAYLILAKLTFGYLMGRWEDTSQYHDNSVLGFAAVGWPLWWLAYGLWRLVVRPVWRCTRWAVDAGRRVAEADPDWKNDREGTT